MTPTVTNPAPLPHTVADQGRRNRAGNALPKQQTTPSALEVVSEVSDLAAGLGILTFTLAPLAIPALALTALLALPLLIPVLLGAMLAPPFLLASRWLRARDRSSNRTNQPVRGDWSGL